MSSSVSAPDYELRWPRHMFRTETAGLLNSRDVSDWHGRVELLLEEAFVGSVPKDDFKSQAGSLGPIDDRHKFLAGLLRKTETLREATERAPYFSERRSGMKPGQISVNAASREFVRIVRDLEDAGYLERAFGKDCVDDRSDVGVCPSFG